MNAGKEPVIDDREWEIQERGLHAARTGGEDGMDPAAESYRRVATALIRGPHAEPPADFATGVLEQVASRQAGMERALLRSLSLVLAASTVAVTALYAAPWWQAMQGMLGDGAPGWAALGTGCVVVSWMVRQLHPGEPSAVQSGR